MDSLRRLRLWWNTFTRVGNTYPEYRIGKCSPETAMKFVVKLLLIFRQPKWRSTFSKMARRRTQRHARARRNNKAKGTTFVAKYFGNKSHGLRRRLSHFDGHVHPAWHTSYVGPSSRDEYHIPNRCFTFYPFETRIAENKWCANR